MLRFGAFLGAVALVSMPAQAQSIAERIVPPAPDEYSAAVTRYVAQPAGDIAIRNVRIIDGTGANVRENATILIKDELIVAIGDAAMAVPEGTVTIDGEGKTVLPGLVGMHDHFFYTETPNLQANGRFDGNFLVGQMTYSSPRMYLAKGVTTLRTTGSIETFTELNLKAQIDAGQSVGPRMDVTAPYIDGAASPLVMLEHLETSDEVRQKVNYWVDRGVTSFKTYMWTTSPLLAALTDEAHKRGVKVTGHLCAISYPEAVALGIDNLEHGFFVNSQLGSGRTPDECNRSHEDETLMAMDPSSDEAKALIKLLVDEGVAITSTLPVMENYSPDYGPLDPEQVSMLAPGARQDYFIRLARTLNRPEAAKAQLAQLWANGLGMEKAFYDAGGLLIVGPDPTAVGDTLPGFGNVRGVQLLVDAGLTPLEAIKAATLHGAIYLGVDDKIGSIAVGKRADLILVEGNPAANIADLGNTITVFKDGVGYDPQALLDAARGNYGRH